MRSYWAISLTLMLTAGCGVEEGPEPGTRGPGITSNQHACHFGSSVGVMSRNLYVGAGLERILGVQSPEEIPLAVALTMQMQSATNWPERASALADEIAFTQPHLIGLQEVSMLRMQFPSDAIYGGTTPAEDVVADYLASLLAELQSRGLDYVVAGTVQNFDGEFPMVNPDYTFTDVRLTDFDVILARGDVATSGAVAANFSVALPVMGLEVTRGWVAVDAEVNGSTYRFVNTHLEAFHPDVNAAQAYELTMILSADPRQMIVVGDFNSAAATGAAYQLMLGAGFTDAWTKRWGFPSDGFTCCQAEDLANETSTLSERVDLIFTRAMQPKLTLSWTTGDDAWSRTPSGLWPSDHAGVVAWMLGN